MGDSRQAAGHKAAATHPSWTSDFFLILVIKKKKLLPQLGRKLPQRLLDHRWGGGTLNVTSYLQEASQPSTKTRFLEHAVLSLFSFARPLPPKTRSQLKTSP